MTAWTSDPPEREGWYWIDHGGSLTFGKFRKVNGRWLYRDSEGIRDWAAAVAVGERRIRGREES